MQKINNRLYITCWRNLFYAYLTYLSGLSFMLLMYCSTINVLILAVILAKVVYVETDKSIKNCAG